MNCPFSLRATPQLLPLKHHHEQQKREAAGTTWQHEAHSFTSAQAAHVRLRLQPDAIDSLGLALDHS
ncbi:hypothetical protein [Streptomyces solincola]|uniref:hypothetical protein n=1 Tax=Streptomyces solincola TaxID=2100817 RepID=UPI0011B26A82|nr:hypothetical protein [Streptomyces solincola]